MVSVVSPEAAGKDKLENAMTIGGVEEGDVEDDEQKVVLLADYGVKATLFEKNGNNYKTLMKEAKEEMEKINMLFGFYMDKQMNAIGNTGWDFVAGDIGFK